MPTILVFGDSLAFGAWDIEGGWVQRLRKFLDEKNISNIPNFTLLYNFGISGNTSKDLLERFEFETKQIMKDSEGGEKLTLIFGIGGNDSAIIPSKKDFWIPPKKFEKNIEKLIEKARKFTKRIIFVGLVPFDESKTNPPIFASDISYKNENARRYNEIVKSVCQREEIDFVDIFGKFMETDYKKLLQDGAHPNSKGHQKIFETVRDFLLEKKLI